MAGSWGNELISVAEKYYQRNLFSRKHKQLKCKLNIKMSRLRFIIGDVRDKNILSLSMKNVDYVFHLTALNMFLFVRKIHEGVLTNIYGTQNVIEAAIENDVKKVIDISTDKAVDPFNHYGVTKAMKK